MIIVIFTIIEVIKLPTTQRIGVEPIAQVLLNIAEKATSENCQIGASAFNTNIAAMPAIMLLTVSVKVITAK